ncbi:MAG: biotin--[acetyl-CoA-carboxylase] ligase [Chlamydiia bacterium]|nr:biotin--[acetyl-CoA-carboxylase] ligase [Chlamydiia bacterium]
MVEKLITIHLDSVDSTNTYAKENHRQFHQETITRITADAQSKGRGRFKREWVSPKGLNIYLTYYFTAEKNPMGVNNITQVLCLSIAKLLHREGLKPQIKWPNDILINQKKISGILCETIDLGETFGVALGAGLNVNMPQELLDTIDQPATSLQMETGKTYDKNALVKALDQFFLEDYTLYKREGFKPFYMCYDSLLTHKGMPITLHQNGELLSGTLHSLNPDGRLNLLLPNGEIQTISSGEIKK